MIVAFVGFSRIFLLGILICKGLTARSLYKSFGVKGLILCYSVEQTAPSSHSFHDALYEDTSRLLFQF
jgi:hypothetical protein